MADRYILLDTKKFLEFMSQKGFEESTEGNELVFVRAHNKDKRIKIKCYSSLTPSGMQKDYASDAIRVCAIFDDGKGRTIPIHSTSRTYRTGSTDLVIQRVYKRLQEAYDQANKWRKFNYIKE